MCMHAYCKNLRVKSHCMRMCIRHCKNVRVISTLPGLAQLHLFRFFYNIAYMMALLSDKILPLIK